MENKKDSAQAQQEVDDAALDRDKNSQQQSSRFQEGQILNFVKVRFPGHARSYQYFVGKRKYNYGQKVVAMSDRGMAVGYINSFLYQRPFKSEMLPLRSINRQATDDDSIQYKQHVDEEKKAYDLCTSLVSSHKLSMDITHVEFTQFGKKAVFYFIAPERVDFRGLVKDLVSKLKMRIELRQISIRDRAASLGGLGPCGRQLCCSTFLTSYGRANMKMAKNQNLSLIPSRLNGLCGQLKCCTAYENNVYNQKREILPEVGDFIEAANGDRGKITKLHLLLEQFDMLTDRGVIRRYASGQHQSDTALPGDWSFPTHFEHISHETNQVIGLEPTSSSLALERLKQLPNREDYEEYFIEGDEIEIDEEDQAEQMEEGAPPPEKLGQEKNTSKASASPSSHGPPKNEKKRPAYKKNHFRPKGKNKRRH